MIVYEGDGFCGFIIIGTECVYIISVNRCKVIVREVEIVGFIDVFLFYDHIDGCAGYLGNVAIIICFAFEIVDEVDGICADKIKVIFICGRSCVSGETEGES